MRNGTTTCLCCQTYIRKALLLQITSADQAEEVYHPLHFARPAFSKHHERS